MSYNQAFLDAALEVAARAWDEAMELAAEIAWTHDGSASSAITEAPNPYRSKP